MAFGSNKLGILSVICISILAICCQAHAPGSDLLSFPEDEVLSMKNDLLSKLEKIDELEQLDLTKIPAENREKVKMLIVILKEMKVTKFSGTDEIGVKLEKVKRAQVKWQEARAIFREVNLMRSVPHAKPDAELAGKLKSLLNEVDSNIPDGDVVTKQQTFRATLSAFKKRLGLSSKALEVSGAPKKNPPGQPNQTAAGKDQPKVTESEIKESVAVALQTFSDYIDSYFKKTVSCLEKEENEIRNPRRRRKRGISKSDILYYFLKGMAGIIYWLIMLLIWGIWCILSGFGPAMWAYSEYMGERNVCTMLGNDLRSVFFGHVQRG